MTTTYSSSNGIVFAHVPGLVPHTSGDKVFIDGNKYSVLHVHPVQITTGPDYLAMATQTVIIGMP
jgi:hypothetical protein